jgi:hypothetical protein
MRVALVLVLGLALAGCADWRPRDQALFTVNVGCQGVDYAQTSWAMDHGYREANPVLGDSPSQSTLVLAKAAAIGATWYIADTSPKQRTTALVVATALCLVVIAHNHSEGARP